MEDSDFSAEPPETPETPDFNTSEKPKKNFLLYGIALLWSFFLVFIFMYFIVYRHQKTTMENNFATNQALQDSLATDSLAVNDSTHTALVDSTVQKVESDTVKKGKTPLPNEGFLTVEDEMRILQLENGRRKREIDYLWNEMRTIKKQSQELAEKATQVDTPKVVPVQVVPPDTTPSFAELRQKQLEKEQKEKARLAEIQAEQNRQEQVLAANAKLYSSMTPKQAALILNEFDNATVAGMLKKIRERQAAKILKEMKQEKAIEICKLMAK